MAESTGFLNAKTLHSALRLGSEEMEEQLQQERQLLDDAMIRTYALKGITHENGTLDDPNAPGTIGQCRYWATSMRC